MRATGLIIDVEGKEADIEMFMKELAEHPPALARISSFLVNEMPPAGADTFQILESMGR